MAKAKPFRWIGSNEHRVLWLDVPGGERKVISAGGEVRKDENLAGITLEWQKEKEKAGLLQFLDLGERMTAKGEDGKPLPEGAATTQSLGADPLSEDEQKLAQETLSQSLATSKNIEKLNKVAADKSLEKAIDASDKREQTVAGNADQPSLGDGVGAS